MKNIKSILFVAIAMSLSAGCETKLLEPRASNQQEISRILNDPAYAEGLLHSAYSHLPTAYSFDDAATDDAVSNDKSSVYRRMATGEWSALYSPVSVWTASYAAIFHLNFLLSVAEDVEWSWQSESRNELFTKKNMGEAYALRGYFYLQLLAKHAGVSADGQLLGVPLVTEPIGVNDDWRLPRAAFAEVMAQINSDFDQALKLLPDVWQSTYASDDSLRVMGVQNQGRIQGKIVRVLKAKAALLAASPAFNGGSYDTEKAAAAANLTGTILKEIGGTAGMPSKGIVFYNADTDIANPEIIWRTNHSTGSTLEQEHFPPSLFGRGRLNPTQNLVDAFPMKSGYPISHPASGYDAAKPYENRDSRLASAIISDGSTYRSTTINTRPSGTTVDGLNLSIYSTRTGFYLKKLMREDVNLTPGAVTGRRHFYTHLRYTELYLNYAEAANEAWGPDADPNGYGFTARSIIAKIRQRAGIDAEDPYLATITDKGAMRELVRNERRLELCFEGHRFWDLRRWQSVLNTPAQGISIENGVYNPILVENRLYTAPRAFFGPVPQEEIIKNDLILQNTGW